MAISPVSDIIKDVVDAAEPQAVSAARARLATGAPVPSAAATEPFAVDLPAQPAPRVEAAAKNGPYQKFEAMVLGNFMEAMLPDDVQSAYGGGMAGGMWKSMLADKLGQTLAQRGGIGIADRLLGDHYTTQDGKIVPVGPATEVPDQAKAGEAMLSTSLVAEFQRKALRLQADAPEKSGL